MSELISSPSAARLFNRAFVMLLVAQLCFGFTHSSFLLLPKYMVTELAATAAQIGWAMACFGVVVVVCLPLLGAAVDRHGRRDFLTAGSLLMAATTLAYTAVEDVGPLLFALRALQAIAFSMAFAAGAALAVDAAPPERLGQAIGIFGLTFLSMNGGATFVIENLAESSGWKSCFALSACVALVAAALSRAIPERPRAPATTGNGSGLLEMARRPDLLRPMLVAALAGTAMCAMFVFYQPFALELGMTQLRSFFVAYTVTAIVTRLGFGHLIDRVGRRRVSLLSLLGYVVIVTGMAWLEPGRLAFFGAALGIAHGLFYPAINAVAVEGLGEDERGKGMALFQAGFNAGFAGSAWALGLLAEAAGYPAVFFAGGACSFAALLLLLFSRAGK